MTILFKETAIRLRKEGRSYSEILKVVPVAKSTLSLWLRDVGLSKSQKQSLTDKKLVAAKRGGLMRRQMRENITEKIYSKALRDVGMLTKRESWLVGTALYWAEGTKEKECRHGSGLVFTNSDPDMIEFFLYWLREFCNVDEERIYFEIYLHETTKKRVSEVVNHWSQRIQVSKERLCRVYFKKNIITTKRKNVGGVYWGTVKIKVRESSSLVRYISGCSKGILKGSKFLKH